MYYQKHKSEDIAKKSWINFELKVSQLLLFLMNCDTESSASNDFWLGSNDSTKVRTFTFNNKNMKKIPFWESKIAFWNKLL